MMLPPEDVPFSNLHPHPGSKFYAPPAGTIPGAVNSYLLLYQTENQSGLPAVSIDVALFTDSTSASNFINGQISDLVAMEGSDLGNGVILTSIDTYPILGIGDKATRVVMHLTGPSGSVYATIATYTQGRLVGDIQITRSDSSDMQSQAEGMASALFARMKGVFAGTITSTTAPLPPDANCSGAVDAIDALLVLQLDAGLIGQAALGCAPIADASGDDMLNSVDSLLMLQFAAGLIVKLPL